MRDLARRHNLWEMEPEIDRIIPDLVFNPLPVQRVRGPETLDAFELGNTGENVIDGDDDMDEGDEAESEEGGENIGEGDEGSQAAPAEGDDDILNVIPPKKKNEGTCPYLEYFATRITRKLPVPNWPHSNRFRNVSDELISVRQAAKLFDVDCVVGNGLALIDDIASQASVVFPQAAQTVQHFLCG